MSVMSGHLDVGRRIVARQATVRARSRWLTGFGSAIASALVRSAEVRRRLSPAATGPRRAARVSEGASDDLSRIQPRTDVDGFREWKFGRLGFRPARAMAITSISSTRESQYGMSMVRVQTGAERQNREPADRAKGEECCRLVPVMTNYPSLLMRFRLVLNLIGTRSGGGDGASCAGAEHRPSRDHAGLSRVANAQISASAGVYKWIAVAPEHLPHGGGSVQNVQNFVGGTFHLRGRLHGGAVFLTTNSWLLEINSELFTSVQNGQERLGYSADSLCAAGCSRGRGGPPSAGGGERVPDCHFP